MIHEANPHLIGIKGFDTFVVIIMVLINDNCLSFDQLIIILVLINDNSCSIVLLWEDPSWVLVGFAFHLMGFENY